jgi:hypothetical protein
VSNEKSTKIQEVKFQMKMAIFDDKLFCCNEGTSFVSSYEKSMNNVFNNCVSHCHDEYSSKDEDQQKIGMFFRNQLS